MCLWRRKTATTACIVLQTATLQLFATTKHHFHHDGLPSSHCCSPNGSSHLGDVRNLNMLHEYISSMELMNGCAWYRDSTRIRYFDSPRKRLNIFTKPCSASVSTSKVLTVQTFRDCCPHALSFIQSANPPRTLSLRLKFFPEVVVWVPSRMASRVAQWCPHNLGLQPEVSLTTKRPSRWLMKNIYNMFVSMDCSTQIEANPLLAENPDAWRHFAIFMYVMPRWIVMTANAEYCQLSSIFARSASW